MINWTAKNLFPYIGKRVIVTRGKKWQGVCTVLDARAVRDCIQVQIAPDKWVSGFYEYDCAVRNIARRFSVLLWKELGAERFGELCDRSLKHTDPLTCLSGDYCDSNMVMLDALTFCTDIKEMDIQNDEQRALWSAAWSLARAANFELHDEHVYKTLQGETK